jgi:hypothetical protein
VARAWLNLEVVSTTELDAVDAVGMAVGASLFTLGVWLIAVGLSTPSLWGLVVYGVVLTPLGAASVAYSAATKGQTTKTHDNTPSDLNQHGA